MNRHSFLWPVATGRVVPVVNTIPNAVYWAPANAPSFLPEVHYTRSNSDVLRCWILPRILDTALPHEGISRAANGRWDVFQMTPRMIVHYPRRRGVSYPRNLGTKVMNRLGQFILNHPELNEDAQGHKWAGRPLSFAQVAELYPQAAADYLGTPVMLNPTPGDTDPAQGAAVDYRPTDQQMIEDADAPDGVWPAEPGD